MSALSELLSLLIVSVTESSVILLLWFKNSLKTPNVRDLCAWGMLNANEVNDWPAWCLGRSTPRQECCASVFKESLSSLKSFSLGTLFNSFIYRCTSNSEWICSFASGSVSLNEFTKGKLNWNESFVAQTFLVSSLKFHSVVAKYITQFLFLLLFFILLFPIDSDGQVAFWHILCYPASVLGRKSWRVLWLLSSGCVCFQWKW